MFKKIFVGIALVASFNVVPLFVFADHNTAHTIQQLQAQINALLTQIQNLRQQTQLTQTPTPVPTQTPLPSTPFCHNFNTNLRIGDSGQEVSKLYEVLTKQGFIIASANAASAFGKQVSFDEQMAAAVSAFQEKYLSEILTPNGLSHGNGYVGISTRAKLNQLYGCNVQGPPPPSIPMPPLPLNIKVNSPNGGQSFKIGDQVNVQWFNASSERIGIALRLAPPGSGLTDLEIIKTTNNTKSYTWTIPSVAPSSYYFIKVCSLGKNIIGEETCSPDEDLSDAPFSIIAQTTTPQPVTGTSFSFSHNGAQMIAGKDTWTMSVSGLQGGDNVYVDAWKDTAPLGKFKICDAQTTAFGVVCSGKGTPTDADAGSWEEAVIVRRDGVNITIAPKGAIKFGVVKSAVSPVVSTARSSITVNVPVSGAIWEAGKSSVVNWTSQNLPVSALLNVSIFNKSTYNFTLLFSGTSNDGSETLTLPSTLTAGNYVLIIDCFAYKSDCLSGESEAFSIIGATSQIQPVSQPIVTFSHDGGTLVAGQNSWTFTLDNAHAGDVLSVRASKGGVDQGIIEICKAFPVSCTKTGTPSSFDIGTWIEDVLINGIPIGKKITFNVVAPVPQQLSNASFIFSHNGGKLTASKDLWTLSVSGLQGGDSVYVDAWKKGAALGKFKICDVPATSFHTSCSGTGSPTDADIGMWEEAVIVRRGGVDTTVAFKGAIKFEVVKLLQPVAQPIVTFTPNGGTLIAGKDAWTFKLDNAKVGDKLEVIAYKNGNIPPIGRYIICTVQSAPSCSSSSIPGTGDIGRWVESLLINGADTGQTISFSVVAPPTTPTPQPVTGTSFSFSHNGAQMIAGKDTWTMSVSGLQGGDNVYVDAWKDTAPLGKFKICDAQATAFGVVCNSTGTPTDADAGSWEEAVIVRRSGIDTTIAPRGAIKFSVVKAVQPTIIVSPPVSFTFSHNGANMVAGRDTWTFSLINGKIGDALEVIARKDDAYSGRYSICTVQSGSSCSASGAPGGADLGKWTESVLINGIEKGTIQFYVVANTSSISKDFASVIYAMMETLSAISKQLDLLK